MTDAPSCVSGPGISWGLEYPLVYGELPMFDGFMVWDRHTGEVKAAFPHERNQHGWSPAEYQARKFSIPVDYDFNPFELDAVP